MLINDLVSLLMQIPPLLAASWAAWFFVGLVLSIWQRKEQARLVVHGPAPKQKSGVRPPSGVRAATPAHSVPMTSRDAFGELERILEPEIGGHRVPGDRPSPVLAEVTGSNGAALAAPQSVP